MSKIVELIIVTYDECISNNNVEFIPDLNVPAHIVRTKISDYELEQYKYLVIDPIKETKYHVCNQVIRELNENTSKI